jgi:FPC/CPF motif-containing protein YcgG
MGGLSPQQSLSLYAADNPFVAPAAFKTSNYCGYIDGQLIRLLDWREPSGLAKMAHHQLRSFLTNDRFSCVAGKAAVSSGAYRFGFYDGFPSKPGTHGLARDLAAFVAEMPHMNARYATFIAVFNDRCGSEAAFEARLWEQLQALHDVDARYFGWAPGFSNDPADPGFAYSIASHPFFLVAMHPAASRISRRFALPAIAFNSHEQFRRLKATGHFERITSIVRKREIELQGSLKGDLAEHGARSEARQYAGRVTEEDWKCPFHPQ